jgi:hypothetical protein
MKRKKVLVEIKLRDKYKSLQDKFQADLKLSKHAIAHPVSKGDSTELCWIEMLKNLPTRYQVEKGYVIDSQNNVSEQIDIIVFDRNFCPFMLDHKGLKLVPAESVYAVFEVKPSISKGTVRYAGGKIASVRRLKRTSVPIPHAGGVYPPKELTPILGGLLATTSDYTDLMSRNFQDALDKLPQEQKIDVGCAVSVGAFEVEYQNNKKSFLNVSDRETALINFFWTLIARLQKLGTIAAMDIRAYQKAVETGGAIDS